MREGKVVKKYVAHADVRAIGDQTIVTPVTLRLSYVIHLISRGVSEIVYGEQMGNPTAVNWYSHPTKVAKRRAADLMEEDM